MDLALLGVFKYTNFALATVNGVCTWLGQFTDLPLWHIVLPVGISFYTFHTITYIVDAYRGVITPTRNFFEFASYVSLFPQLVAGPIVRFRQIERDLENIDHAERRADLNIGWSFFLIGLSKKVLVADTIAAVINPALARHSDLSTVDAWMCMLGSSWTFVVWGGYHGLLLVLYQAGRGSWARLPTVARRTATFGLVVVGWVFFRSDTFEMAAALLIRMFSWHAGSSLVGGPVLLGLLIVAAAAAHWGPNTFELPHRWSPSYVAGFALLFGMCLLVLYGAPSSPFLYFQF